jgi:flagellar biosynthesis protein FlhG
MRATSKARIIAVAGGKGGVGKTTIAINLGIALASSETSTILVDADFCLAGIRILTGATPTGDVGDVLAGDRSIDELLSPAGAGLRVLGGLPAGRHGSDADWRAALDRLRGSSDAIIIDGGSGVTDAVLAAVRASDQLILPTTPEPTSLADSYAFLKLLNREKFAGTVGVMATMTESDAQAAEVARRIRDVARQFLGLDVTDLGGLPRDAHVSRAVQQRSPVVTRYPHCPASRALYALARRIDPRQPAIQPAGVLPQIAALFL